MNVEGSGGCVIERVFLTLRLKEIAVPASPPNGEQAMRKLRFRFRSVMIAIAFVALILTVIIQGFLLRQMAIRQQVERNISEQARAEAQLQADRARALAERALRAQEMLERVEGARSKNALKPSD
jgi:hypothetical protein